ncbi:hypothetical protein EMIT07CA2_550054 [Brevibacillus sp. IT-7CA2]|uniref:hypothetical protein n=1 Tax=Brevibacillus sp. IT-7CA2 TaxID=3026436 RepID=UPI0039E1BC1A
MTKQKRIFYHFLTPILVGLGAYTFYWLGHVSSDSISIPPGMQQDQLKPLEMGQMIQYWKEKALLVGWWSFGISAVVSTLIYLYTWKASKKPNV